jgi:aminoglycoside/choline kinase family phosphotransferase
MYMLDWQLLHQGCPAYDLAYFLTGSFREVQIEEFGDRLIKAYYETLTTAPTTKVKEGEYSYEAFMRDLHLELFPSSLCAPLLSPLL